MTVDCFLLESLEAAGFTVTEAAGVLSVGPKERLTPELRESIRAAKRYILDDLEARSRHRAAAEWRRIELTEERQTDGTSRRRG